MNNNDCKIIFVGESGVGKTSIIKYLQGKQFDENNLPTIGTNYIKKSIKIGDINLDCDLWDTVGGERYRGLGKLFYNKADIVIFVFDITNSKTLDEIKNFWYNEVKENAPEKISKIIS